MNQDLLAALVPALPLMGAIILASLRRKLSDAGGDAGLIETVRGAGYKMREAPG